MGWIGKLLLKKEMQAKKKVMCHIACPVVLERTEVHCFGGSEPKFQRLAGDQLGLLSEMSSGSTLSVCSWCQGAVMVRCFGQFQLTSPTGTGTGAVVPPQLLPHLGLPRPPATQAGCMRFLYDLYGYMTRAFMGMMMMMMMMKKMMMMMIL